MKKIKKKIKRSLKKFLIKVCVKIIPYIYLFYIKFVWKTSKVIDQTNIPKEFVKKNPPYKIVAALWHQDVFCVPWAYKNLNTYTIANIGDAGDVITAILELFNFTVIRGGSSKSKKRKRVVLYEFISIFKKSKYSIGGITVDGASGPLYKFKPGAILIANKCNCPIFLCRIWAKKRILLPTWDKTMIPLPFNKIVILTKGPFYYTFDIKDKDKVEKFRELLENELLKLTYESFIKIDGKIPEEFEKFFKISL